MRSLLIAVILGLVCAARATRFVYSVGEPCTAGGSSLELSLTCATAGTLASAEPYFTNDTQCGSLAGAGYDAPLSSHVHRLLTARLSFGQFSLASNGDIKYDVNCASCLAYGPIPPTCVS